MKFHVKFQRGFSYFEISKRDNREFFTCYRALKLGRQIQFESRYLTFKDIKINAMFFYQSFGRSVSKISQQQKLGGYQTFNMANEVKVKLPSMSDSESTSSTGEEDSEIRAAFRSIFSTGSSSHRQAQCGKTFAPMQNSVKNCGKLNGSK